MYVCVCWRVYVKRYIHSKSYHQNKLKSHHHGECDETWKCPRYYRWIEKYHTRAHTQRAREREQLTHKHWKLGAERRCRHRVKSKIAVAIVVVAFENLPTTNSSDSFCHGISGEMMVSLCECVCVCVYVVFSSLFFLSRSFSLHKVFCFETIVTFQYDWRTKVEWVGG